MKTKLFFVLLAAVAMVGCGQDSMTAPTASGHDTTPANNGTQVDRERGVEIIPGCDEDIELRYQLKAMLHENGNDNHFGGFIEFSVHGNGVGLDSGCRYVYSQKIRLHINEMANGAENFRAKEEVMLRAQGQKPDVRLRASFHVTVNANGEVVVLNERFAIQDCP